MGWENFFGEEGMAMPLGLALMRMGGRSDRPRNLGVELGAALQQQQAMKQAKQKALMEQFQMERLKAAVMKEKKQEGLAEQLALLPQQFMKPAVPGAIDQGQIGPNLPIQSQQGQQLAEQMGSGGTMADLLALNQSANYAQQGTPQEMPLQGQPASMDYKGLMQAAGPIQAQLDPQGYFKALQEQAKPKPPIKVGADDTLLDPVTMQPVYQGVGKDVYKERTNVKTLNGVPHYIKEYSDQGGKSGTWQPLSDPYPIKSTVASNNNNVTIAQEKEFEKELGKGQAKSLLESRQSADDAVQIINTVGEGKKLLKSGIITGIGADYIVGFGQALKQAGLTNGSDAVANTQAYTANMAQNVGKIIKQFGAGTGLSDADRDYAAQMAGGKVNIDKKAIEKILDINERGARNILKLHNKRASGIKTNIPLTVEEPAASNDGWSMKPIP